VARAFHVWVMVSIGVVGCVVVACEVAGLDAMEELEGAMVLAMLGLPRALVREPIRLLVAYNPDVGRDPLNENISVFEYVVVDFAHRAYEGMVGFGLVVFGYCE
jgi:hypothetical protein